MKSYRDFEFRENVEIRLYAPHLPYRKWFYEEIEITGRSMEERVKQINDLAENNPDKTVLFVKANVGRARLFLWEK